MGSGSRFYLPGIRVAFCPRVGGTSHFAAGVPPTIVRTSNSKRRGRKDANCEYENRDGGVLAIGFRFLREIPKISLSLSLFLFWTYAVIFVFSFSASLKVHRAERVMTCWPFPRGPADFAEKTSLVDGEKKWKGPLPKHFDRDIL